MYKSDFRKDAYHYENYVPDLSGAKIKVIDNPAYISPYSHSEALVYTFLENAKILSADHSLDAFLKAKLTKSEDQIDLILGEIRNRDILTYDNLRRLYDDLLRINQWRAEIPYPQNYMKDRTWSDLNRSELQIRDQIRRELKDSHKDMAFPQKDLRHSLLEFKLQNAKQNSIDDLMDIDMNPKNEDS